MVGKGLKSFIFQFGGAAIGFLFQFIAAKWLGSEEYGVFNYYYGIIGTLGVFFFLGFSLYLPKIYHKNQDGKALISRFISTFFVVFLLLTPLIYLVLEYRFNDNLIIGVILLGTILFSLIELVRAFYVSRLEPIKASFIRSFVLQLLSLVFFIVLYNFYENYWSILSAIILAHLVIIIPFIFRNYSFRKPSIKLLQGAFSFYLVQLFYFSYVHFSKVLQAEFQSFEIVGALSMALVFGKFITMLGTHFSYILMPEIAYAWDNSDLLKIKSLYKQITRINVFLVFPIILFLIINITRLLTILGVSYTGYETIFLLIILSSAFTSFIGPNGSILLMTGNQRKEIFNGLLAITVGIGIGLLLGRKYVYGIALSIAMAELVVGISKRLMTYLIIRASPYTMKEFGYIFAFGVIQFILLYAASMIDSIFGWAIISIILIFGSMTFNFIFSPVKTDLEIVQNGIKKLLNK